LRRALSPKPSCASTRLQARRSKCLTGPTAPPASVLSRTLHASRQRGGRPRAPAGTCAGGTPRGSRPSAAHPQSAARSGRRAACGCGVPPRPWAPGRLRQEGRPCHRLRAQRRAPPLVTGYKSPGQRVPVSAEQGLGLEAGSCNAACGPRCCTCPEAGQASGRWLTRPRRQCWGSLTSGHVFLAVPLPINGVLEGGIATDAPNPQHPKEGGPRCPRSAAQLLRLGAHQRAGS